MNRNKKRRFVALLLALSAVFSVLCLSGCSGDNKIVLYVNINGANDGETFNNDIFSTRRIVAGPTMAFIGFVAMAISIIFKGKK